MNRADRLLIRRANREVSVFDVLEAEFDIRHPRDGRYKGYCPFSFEHPEQWEKGFRTYPESNSAFCFVMHGSLGPVRLIELKEDLSPLRAAKKLLGDRGLLEPKDPKERWDELMAEKDKPALGSPQVLVEALQQHLSLHPAYADNSFSMEFMEATEHQLAVLDRVMADERASDVIVRAWYSKAKSDLGKVLDGMYEGVKA